MPILALPAGHAGLRSRRALLRHGPAL